VVSAGPVNYQDQSGAWQPIDDTLVPSTVPGYAWQNRADGYRVLLPADLGGAPIRVQRGGAWLSFQLAGAAARGSVSGNTVTYPDALPGVTVSFAAVGDEVKESLLLANPGVQVGYTFRVQTAPGLSVKPNGTGGLDVYSGSAFQFALPAPFMTDAPGAPQGFSRAVSFSTQPTPGGLSLEVTADPAWLHRPERRWPVVIDPTVTLVGPAVNADCHIVGGSFATQSFCASTELEVGSSSTGARHGLLYFPVEGALPRDSQVVAATLSAYVPRAGGNGALTVGVRQLTRSFTTTRPGTATTASTPGRPRVGTTSRPRWTPSRRAPRPAGWTGRRRGWCRAGSTARPRTTGSCCAARSRAPTSSWSGSSPATTATRRTCRP